MLWRTDTQKAPIAQPARVLEKPSNSLRKQSVLRSPGFPEIPGSGAGIISVLLHCDQRSILPKSKVSSPQQPSLFQGHQ